MEQIKVTIQNGRVEMDVEGVRGRRCVELTEALEQILGKVESRSLKQGYFKPAEVRQRVAVEQVSLRSSEKKA